MRYVVLLFVCGAGMLAYVHRMALTIPSRTIQTELNLSLEAMGIVLGAWYWVYALFQLPTGWLADKLGGKWSLLLYVVTWSLFVGLVSLANGFVPLLALWAATGMAQAGLIPAMAKNVSAWFAPSSRAFASGVFISSMAMGGALAPLFAVAFLNIVSWRGMLVCYVLPGLVWALAFAVLVPNRVAPPAATVTLGEGLRRMVSSLPMQLLCLQMFLRAAAMAFFYTWFPRFLQETRNLSPAESGSFAIWPGVGGVVGGLLGGLISDGVLRLTGNRRWSRQGLAVVGMVCCAMLAGTSYFIDDIHLAVLLISLGAFAGTAGGVSGYAVAIELGGQRPATVMSLMNTCGSIGAGLFAFLVGVLVEFFGRWEPILLLFAGLFAVDAVCWLCLKADRPLFADPPAESNS